MKKQVYNPYLPSWEYLPDGEPRVFGDRVYVYGSHDRFNAPIFCVNDYVCWSASVEDLSDWRYEGVIYRKNQDPRNKLGLRLLFAPDVVRDGSVAGFKYFQMDGANQIRVEVSGNGDGVMQVSEHRDFRMVSATLPICPTRGITGFSGAFTIEPGKKALYFRFLGTGAVNFHGFELMTR